MTTDPAVQAAQTYLHNIFCGTPSCDLGCLEDARSVVSAVTPLIRAQAFTEAAEAIEALPTPVFPTVPHSYASGASDTRQDAAALVRGLGEETENA